jgi:lysine 2,3-aminomutase
MERLDASRPAPETEDWRWQSRHAITTFEALDAAFALTDAERAGARRAIDEGFPLSITPYYAALADRADASCPIRRQCVPHARESYEAQSDLRDPLGEEAHEVAPHLVSRYPDRALLLATDHCAVYCRFCTRSRIVGAGQGARSMAVLAEAFTWIEAHPEIQDVIVSGGDPLVMSTDRIATILERLAKIESVAFVRLATRAPVTLPQRVTDELCRAIRGAHPSVWVMTHFNHPKELSPRAIDACAKLVDHGIPVMNQTVLLRGINDDATTLATLFRGLVKTRVRPYYLLQADPVRGTSHLRTPIATGVAIMEALQGRLSGIALPKLIVDTPGGMGKVPVGPEYVVGHQDGVTTFRTHRGVTVQYFDPE